MNKILTFNEFKDRLSYIDSQISIHEEFNASCGEIGAIQSSFYMSIILRLKMERNQLFNNPDYFQYIEKLKMEKEH